MSIAREAMGRPRRIRGVLAAVVGLACVHACATGETGGDDAQVSDARRLDVHQGADGRGDVAARDVFTAADAAGVDVGPVDAGRPRDVAMPGPVDASMYPAFLRDGRTYDQERDYIAWEGPVDYVTVQHRDGTSLPPSEGGASCGAGCNENLTRINAGGRVRGRFSYVQTFSVQIASGGDPGLGTAVIEACGMVLGRLPLQGTTTLGFTNQPQPAFTVPTPGDCEWSVRAEGGWVPFRAVTVAYRGGAAPTVDVRVDGTNGPLVADAPASYLVSWTSTSAASCVASGAWSGARDVSGATMFTGVVPGSYTYVVACTNGGGTAMDSVTVTVNTPPG